MKELKLRYLLLGSLMDSIGMSFVWPLTTVYMHNILGHSLTVVGIVLMLNSVASIVGAFVAGRLFDKYDGYYLLLGGIAFTALSMLVLVFVNDWPIYPIMLICIGLGTGWILAFVNALGTTVHSKDGRFVFNMLYFVQNLGVMIGTAVVGLMFKDDVAPLFAISTALYAVFFVVAALNYHVKRERPERLDQMDQDANPASKTEKLPHVNMIVMYTLFISLFVIWIFYQQWNSNISVYMLSLHIPLKDYSFLWTVNGLFIVIVQAFLSWQGGKVFKDPFHQVYVGMVFIIASFVILVFATQYVAFVLSMIILTIGEAITFPQIPAIANLLSPYGMKGRYQGLASSFPSAGRALGPLVGSLIIDTFSFVSLFIVAAVAIAIILFVNIVLIEGKKNELIEYK
ncbi:permease of the major facilitator superfamily [Pediococcus damnosus]|uniref:Permease of the major facilitator superfamily n=1 Tax=Pediococcus damnosus TaxID=51663 RepID=A0A143AFN4_9LACO|nr:MFS transporter [Pediococcus damnosus]AMV63036.1 permease of the major facilitator superfamily [Pediococcus damnosus]AMV67075.1 permease of the major facilitator superfamily [Pediococcus damnosus]PIO81147.1 MFS transporter [Pediococcus damnosus]PIO85362.1 MFS transporter [Pediococcus damnosus]PJE49393.1 MFS transporter [Pediococcus damnosus]